MHVQILCPSVANLTSQIAIMYKRKCMKIQYENFLTFPADF